MVRGSDVDVKTYNVAMTRLRAVLAVATRPDANEGQGAGDVETETAKQSMGFCHGLDLFNDL